MLRLFGKTRELAVSFCDSCARICDPACRVEELQERALLSVLSYGVRF